jgi:hypothetical protein
MRPMQKDRWTGYLIFGLAIFMAFCLVFDPYIVLPPAVAWIGRWHPLLVHFPIVVLLAAIIWAMAKRQVPKLLVAIAAISALITAITGFFLSREIAEKGALLVSHQWLGAALALMAACWYGLYGVKLKIRLYAHSLGICLLALLVAAGHYGGMVTHGADYLSFPLADTYEDIPENPLLYRDVVHRILKANCTSCHNENKRKGSLVMGSIEELIRGGESGSSLIPGDAAKSELVRRLKLDPAEEDHMPPEGRDPLKSFEIQILERWIALGASDTLRLGQLAPTEPLYSLVQGLMAPNPQEQWDNLPKVADSTLDNLSTDYRTIRRVAGNSDALSVNVYLPPEYDPGLVTDLAGIAPNIVELDLSGLPLGTAELALVAFCTNLEWLELDRTPVSDSDLEKIDGLKQLRVLKLYETGIGDKGINALKHLTGLNEIYLWNTRITNDGLRRLEQAYPKLSVNTGIGQEAEAFFGQQDSLPGITAPGSP